MFHCRRGFELIKVFPITIPLTLLIWFVTVSLYGYYIFTGSIIPLLLHHNILAAFLLTFNLFFVGIFFYYGISNIVVVVRYWFIREKVKQSELNQLAQQLPISWQPKVQLLYTTYNDFIPYALHQCLNQTYNNVEGVILDNSTDPHYINLIDQFVSMHPEVKLVRDSSNRHAKAGNLNHYLQGVGKNTYDYFVILDSDEMLEEQFVEKCLKMFYFNNIGILQCNHISGQNHNSFMDTFSKSGNFFWPVQNVVRSSESSILKRVSRKDGLGETVQKITHGDTLCFELGHGVMISRECFEDIGQIPHQVAEDLCTSIEAIFKGWNIMFASQIYGNEAFPVSMSALVTRSSKFCSANLQFTKNYFRRVMRSKAITFFQKVDLFTMVLSAPMGALQYIGLIISGILLPILKAAPVTQLSMLVPVMICYFSQSIVDGFFQFLNGTKIWRIIGYELKYACLYGAFYFITVRATVLSLLKRPAKFVVTPKKHHRVTFIDALQIHYGGILFSVLTIAACVMSSGSGWVLLSFLPGCVGFIFELQANHQNQATFSKLEKHNNAALYSSKKSELDWSA